MKPFTSINAKVLPLPIKDIDTDMIIPAQFLTSTTTDLGFWGEHLFERLRQTDPEFPLNLEKYKTAKIIVSRENFGSGSSREHAVWSILGAGFEVVIAPSFADIFFSNSAKNGLVLVELPKADVEEILKEAESGSMTLTVDLETQTVEFENGKVLKFPFDPFRKECILKGNDDLDYILSYSKEIDKWNQNRSQKVFYDTVTANR